MRDCIRCCVVIIGLLLSRGAWAALSFDFTFIDDAGGTFASRGWLEPTSLFQRNIRAAANDWGSRFAASATIVVHVDTHSYAARAGGTNTLGRFLYQNAAGKNVWEFGPLTRILTGNNPGQQAYGFDILLGFDASYVENFYWFDPQPDLRVDPVPANRGDFVSVVLHELGHGFGMTGYRDFPTGQILGSTATQFDDRSYFGGNGNPIAPDGTRNPMYFRGDAAAAVFGSDLHLTHKPPGNPNYSQNFFHLSTCDAGSPDGLEGTLMNGCVLPNGQRLAITPYDLAIYEDLGYPLVEPNGDFNHDGDVDAADYIVWRNQLGDAGSYAVWRSHFGDSLGSGAGSPAVPEPDAGLIAMIGLCLLLTATAAPHGGVASRLAPRGPCRQLRPTCRRGGRAGVRSWSS